MELSHKRNRLKRTVQEEQSRAEIPFRGLQTMAFAQSVLARYGGRYRPVVSASLEFLHKRLNLTLFQTDQSSNVYFGPRLTLTLAMQPPPAPAQSAEVGQQPITGQTERGRLQEIVYRTMDAQTREADEPSVHPQQIEQFASVAVRPLEKRIVREQAAAPPVARILHRHFSPPVPMDMEEVARVQQNARPMPDNFSTPASRAVLHGNSLNIQQLTDDVIQAIDRRIIAQRERLGRL